MSWWLRIKAVLSREVADVKEGLAKAGTAIDVGLQRKQRELDAEPHERVDMIIEDIDAADDRFADLEARIRDETE